MIWLILVAIAVVTDSLRVFIDNYVSDVLFKKRCAVSQKFFYGFAYLVIATILLFVIKIDFTTANLGALGIIFLCGIISSIATISYYRALELDDSTDLGIFFQLAPILYLILGWFFLNETFSPLQIVAFAVIIFAPILIILTTRKRSRKIKLHAVLCILLYTIIAVIGNLIFVKTNATGLDLWSEIPFFFYGKGVADVLIVLLRPKWYKRFKAVFKANRPKILIPFIINPILGVVADFSYRAALVLAPAVAVASAISDSVEPIVIFFMGILLTLIWPKFGRESLNRKTIIVHLIATILVVIGIITLQL